MDTILNSFIFETENISIDEPEIFFISIFSLIIVLFKQIGSLGLRHI